MVAALPTLLLATFRTVLRMFLWGVLWAVLWIFPWAGTGPVRAQTAPFDESRPWYLDDIVHGPGWLHLSGSHRSRFQMLDGQFRPGFGDGDHSMAFVTLLRADVRLGKRFSLTAEIEDARQALADESTPLETTNVNALALLQANLRYTADDLFGLGGRTRVTLGRQTLGIGRRRFVGRQVFRNTIQNFTGLDILWRGRGGRRVHGFYTLPVIIRPDAPERLLDNDIVFDRESFDLQFWGLALTDPTVSRHAHYELAVFGLHERDGAPDKAHRQTENRQLYTASLRLWRPHAGRHLDYELHGAVQFGEQRASDDPQDRRDLDHSAHYVHGEIGYSFGDGWQTRLMLQYDHASGDRDPEDGNSNRFDSLFGPRRPEFGPTGTYGAFNRSNITGPGVRLSIAPSRRLDGFVGYRAFWLDERRDEWGPADLQDRQGRSGTFLGHQIQGRLRWRPFPGNLMVETGFAHLVDGGFARRAPGATGFGDTTYLYTDVTFSF